MLTGAHCPSDLTTTDLPRSKEFYGKLFDWQSTQPVQGTDRAAEIVAGGTPCRDDSVLPRARSSPFNGVVSVQVTDLPGSCTKAGQLGGTVVPGFPFNLPDGNERLAWSIRRSAGHPIGLTEDLASSRADPDKVRVPARFGKTLIERIRGQR